MSKSPHPGACLEHSTNIGGKQAFRRGGANPARSRDYRRRRRSVVAVSVPGGCRVITVPAPRAGRVGTGGSQAVLVAAPAPDGRARSRCGRRSEGGRCQPESLFIFARLAARRRRPAIASPSAEPSPIAPAAMQGTMPGSRSAANARRAGRQSSLGRVSVPVRRRCMSGGLPLALLATRSGARDLGLWDRHGGRGGQRQRVGERPRHRPSFRRRPRSAPP